MKSRVRFEIIGRVAVDRAVDYRTFAITSEVSDGSLTALTVEVEHPEHWALEDIVEFARVALRPLCTLIGIGTTLEPRLGNSLVSPTTAEGDSIGLGFADVHGSFAIVRGLSTMPPESLLSKLQEDLRLARQADYLNSARTIADIVSRIRYGYMVLEQEEERQTDYTPLDDFRHVRNAVSHPELGDASARAFLLANIGSEQVDFQNPIHVDFLEKQCRLLLEESRQVVEAHVTRFWR